jgi:hypothetical protein
MMRRRVSMPDSAAARIGSDRIEVAPGRQVLEDTQRITATTSVT